MNKFFCCCFILLTGLLAACKKEVRTTDICLHDSSIDYLKRWAVAVAQTDVTDDNGKLTNRTFAYGNGYFQINSDQTYNLVSDGAPVNGKWGINKDCQFVLDPNTGKERRFAVAYLSDDSLVIRQTVGHTTVTQHYSAFKCPSLASLQFRWDNAYTLEASYSTDTVFKPQYVYQPGYFKLNFDASYNVVFMATGTQPPPATINGTWGIAQPGCLLVLDKNKPNQRDYDVQKLTNDSLVIWRKDTVLKRNFLRHYAKHK